MGSLASRPKAPSTPQVIYVPQTTGSTITPTVTSGSTTSTPTTIDTEKSVESEARTDDLLRRSRTRTGTIQTSFRGLLDNIANTPKKTLLGE